MPDDFIPDNDGFEADGFVPDGPPQTLDQKAKNAASALKDKAAKYIRSGPISKPPSANTMVGDVLTGFGSDIAKTVFEGGDLLRRAVGMDRVIDSPEVQASITPPPTIAGKTGALASTILQFASPSGLVGKGVKAAETLSAGTKLARVAPYVARVAGEAGAAGAVEGLRSGGDTGEIGKAALLGGAVPAIAGGAPLLIRGASDLLGKTTGAGGEAVRTAATTTSRRFKDAMRNRVTETEIVSDLKNAVKTVADNRRVAYQAQLSGLNPKIQVPKLPVGQSMMNEFKNYRINTKSGLHNLDFSGNHKLDGITRKEDRQLIQDAVNKIVLSTDQSPAGMDSLKQLMYEYADAASPDIAPFFNRLGGTIRTELENNVPGYTEMTRDYSKASELLNNVRSELSANATNPGTTIRKLSYALNQNNDYRKILLESLDAAAGSELKDTLAGYSMRQVMPRGLQGTLASTPLAVGAYLHSPAAAATAVFASPRAVGESLALLSTLRRGAPSMLKKAVQPVTKGTVIDLLEKPPVQR
jgi:hypothetical protein